MLTDLLVLEEVERVEGIVKDMDGLGAAWRTAYATHKPQELESLRAKVEQRMRLHVVHDLPDADRMAEVVKRVKRAQRIERRAKRKG